jgi:Holliday junction resolvase RusA-like endonuclease
MKINLVFSGLTPITLNHSHKISTRGKFATKYKTKEYKQFESLFASKSRLYKAEFSKLNNYFDDKKHCLHVEYKFFYPILTKKGIISKTSKDVDNCIKTTQDCLFQNLLFDDAFITKVSAEKIHCEKPSIEIIVKILTH